MIKISWTDNTLNKDWQGLATVGGHIWRTEELQEERKGKKRLAFSPLTLE